MFLTLTILPSFKLYKFWKRKTTILGGEKKNKAEKKISLRKGRREERNSIYLSFSFPIFSFCWNLLFDETRRVIVSSGQCIKKGWSEEGRAHVTSVISLLTCNNTTSCSRDPCILVSIALIHGIEIENRGGRERMDPTVEGGRGGGSKGAAMYGSILIIVPVIPERSRRVNDFCISPDRSLRSSLFLLPLFCIHVVGAQPSTESFR